MACASLIPSIDPGMLMSVNTILISPRLSKIRIASSAFDAESASNPASRIMSIASIRISGSSSTASTIGRLEVSNASPFECRALGAKYSGQSAASFNVGARLSIRPRSIINRIRSLSGDCPQLDGTWNNMWPEQSRYVRWHGAVFEMTG